MEYCQKYSDFRKEITYLLELLQRYDFKLNEQSATKLINAAKDNKCEADFVNIDFR